MPIHRLPKCALAQLEKLELLRQDRAQESLRPYLIEHKCFPEGRNVNTAPIREDELKALVKVYKLHRAQNFWRENTTELDLVRALDGHLQHEREAEARRAKFRAKKPQTAQKPEADADPASPKKLAPLSEEEMAALDGRRGNLQAVGETVIDFDQALDHLKVGGGIEI